MVIILVFLSQNIYSLAPPVVYVDNKYFFDNLVDIHYISLCFLNNKFPFFLFVCLYIIDFLSFFHDIFCWPGAEILILKLLFSSVFSMLYYNI